MRHQQSCLGGGGGRASASSPAPPPCYPLLVEYLTGVASSTQQLLINSAVWATHTTTAASAQHIYGRKQKKKGWFNDNDNFACGRGPTCHRLLLSLCTFCVLSRMATWERNFISLRRWHKWRHWRAACYIISTQRQRRAVKFRVYCQEKKKICRLNVHGWGLKLN